MLRKALVGGLAAAGIAAVSIATAGTATAGDWIFAGYFDNPGECSEYGRKYVTAPDWEYKCAWNRSEADPDRQWSFYVRNKH